jgi:hypothetical protein
MTPRKQTGHSVATIKFTAKTNGGVCECSCGEVLRDDDNLYDAFNSHRAEAGAEKRIFSQAFRAPNTNDVWRQQYNRSWAVKRG